MCKDMPPLELAIQFHGHICPGLLMGVRVSDFAREHLQVGSDQDEELIAVVENDSCAVDAIQAILGCTFGKGNLVFKDYGKNVYTIASRVQNRAVRIVQKFSALSGAEFDRFRELAGKAEMTDDEASEKEALIGSLFEKIMSSSFNDLFTWQEVEFDFPPKARIYPSVQCCQCGEGVMQPRAVKTDAGWLCPACCSENGGRTDV